MSPEAEIMGDFSAAEELRAVQETAGTAEAEDDTSAEQQEEGGHGEDGAGIEQEEEDGGAQQQEADAASARELELQAQVRNLSTS